MLDFFLYKGPCAPQNFFVFFLQTLGIVFQKSTFAVTIGELFQWSEPVLLVIQPPVRSTPAKSYEKTLKKNQEVPRILSRNPRKSKDLAKKYGKLESSGRNSIINGNKIYRHPKVDQIVVEYGFQQQTKFAAFFTTILTSSLEALS